MNDLRRNVLVFSEDPQTTRELLAAGRPLADDLASSLIAMQLNSDSLQAQETLFYGADEVFMVQASAPLGPETVLQALAHLNGSLAPAIVLLGATCMGTEVAARLGQRLAVPCVSNCLDLGLDAALDLVTQRRTYGGRFIARQLLQAVPCLVTVQPRRFEPLPRDHTRQGRVHELVLHLTAPQVVLKSVRPRLRGQVDIGKAEVIVAAGRGVQNAGDLALLERLAELMGGVLAGSRPLTDDLQWLGADRKVGLSGRTVKPRLYMAVGISGQIEHVVGFRPARTAVAINRDPESPIHADADFSIVEDLYAFVPALIRALEAHQAGSD